MMKLIERGLDRLIELKSEADKLPQLPPNEEAKIENAIAIDHLYYSSALEGSRLTDEQLGIIIHE